MAVKRKRSEGPLQGSHSNATGDNATDVHTVAGTSTRELQGLAMQFHRPQALLGRFCGHLMALFNADMERAAMRRLDLGGTERVLEVGFGPGVGLRVLARRLLRGHVAGIDHSEVMVAQARRRCRGVIDEGRLDLRLGTVTSLPWASETFDAVCSVNNVHFWNPLPSGFEELARVLKHGGQVVIAVHRWAATGPVSIDSGDTRPLADALPSLLGAHGFRDVRMTEGLAMSGRALYCTAIRA